MTVLMMTMLVSVVFFNILGTYVELLITVDLVKIKLQLRCGFTANE